MKASDFNFFSLEGIFFIKFGANVTSFSFKGIPDDIHFSLSHNTDNAEINIHVTRNTIDPTNKPKIVIAKISKENLSRFFTEWSQCFLEYFLEPINIIYNRPPHHKEKEKDMGYISFEDIEKEDRFENVRLGLISILNKTSEVKKKSKLKIKPSVFDAMSQWAGLKETQRDLFENIRYFPMKFKKRPDAGVLFSEKYTGAAIVLNGELFKFRNDINIAHLLNNIFGKELSHALLFKATNAVEIVANAENYTQIADLNQPITLGYVK